jgi:hypothetical protein
LIDSFDFIQIKRTMSGPLSDPSGSLPSPARL